MASRMVEVRTTRTPATLAVGDVFPIDDSGFYYEARAVETLTDGSVAVEVSQRLPTPTSLRFTVTFSAVDATTRSISAVVKMRRSAMRPAGPFTILF